MRRVCEAWHADDSVVRRDLRQTVQVKFAKAALALSQNVRILVFPLHQNEGATTGEILCVLLRISFVYIVDVRYVLFR